MRIQRAESILTAKRSMLAEMPGKVPAGLNYHDLMVQASNEYWSQYQFFSLSDSNGYVLGGLSPEESLNVYGTSSSLISEMTDHLMSLLPGRRPAFFRGNIEAMEQISRHDRLKNPRYVRTVASLKVRVGALESPSGDFELVRASKEHLSMVSVWLNTFNHESQASWDLPTVDMLHEKPYWMLLDRSGQFIGGVVQTMGVEKRLWLGRMFIPQAFRRQGIGRHLIEKVASTVRGKADEIHLHVHEDNQAGVQFYQRLGFHSVGRFFYAKIRD